MSKLTQQTLLLIGGGRWARVYISVLASMTLAGKVIVVSRHGGAALDKALAEAGPGRPDLFQRVDTLEAALAQGPASGAIIANAARDHVRTAETLLAHGVPILVEKPVALFEDDAARLTGLARHRDLRLMPGHVLAQCVYLKNFLGEAKAALRGIASLSITWRDPAGETRYGEAKGHDWSLGVMDDIGPHIATILRLIEPRISCPEAAVSLNAANLSVEVKGSCNHLQFFAELERDAARRERILVLRNEKGAEGRLDFSTEPGDMTINGVTASADPDWAIRPTPLTLQVRSFLDSRAAQEDELTAIVEVTGFVASMAKKLRGAQQSLLDSNAGLDPALRRALLREFLAPRAIAAGRLCAGDNAALDGLARSVLERLAARPGAGLGAVLDELLPLK